MESRLGAAWRRRRRTSPKMAGSFHWPLFTASQMRDAASRAHIRWPFTASQSKSGQETFSGGGYAGDDDEVRGVYISIAMRVDDAVMRIYNKQAPQPYSADC